jgi:methylenetetrahydrofolate--tRNA-(uracil-5-)-methyltransferase
VQLRREDAAGSAWNLVGFQTRMKHGEQTRVFRLIPGLEQARFLRLGVMHRNTYVDGPRALGPDLSLRARPGVRLAGQLVGVEGYLESAAMGLLAAWFAAAELAGRALPPPPETTMLGALLRYVTSSEQRPLQPMNANFGLLPPVERRAKRPLRRQLVHERALADLRGWLAATRRSAS